MMLLLSIPILLQWQWKCFLQFHKHSTVVTLIQSMIIGITTLPLTSLAWNVTVIGVDSFPLIEAFTDTATIIEPTVRLLWFSSED